MITVFKLPKNSGGTPINKLRKITDWERTNLADLNALAKHFNAFGFYGECSRIQAAWCCAAVKWNSAQ